jgi:predicted ferric reductase
VRLPRIGAHGDAEEGHANAKESLAATPVRAEFGKGRRAATTAPASLGGGINFRLVATCPEELVVLGAIALGAAATVWLWWHNTAPFPTTSAGDWLTNAGRTTGLLGGYGLGVLLLLMSRLPWLESRIGAGRLADWHAAGGRYVLALLVAHTVFVVWGYAASTKTSLGSQTTTLLAHYPDVLAATVALGLLLGVGVVTARAVRRRVRYETWFYLHLYTYLAVALAFAHDFATGADFVTHPLARIGWSLFYAAVVAAVLWYRILTPIKAALRHRLRVVEVHGEAAGVSSLVVAGLHLDRLRAQPGQFFRWRFLTRDGWWQAHPFSLSAQPTPSRMRLTVKAIGDHTTALQRIRPGVRVLAEGPYGALTPARRSKTGVLLLAGGIGITALRALLDALVQSPGNIILLYRANHQRELAFRDELDQFRTRHGVDVRHLIGPPSSVDDVLVADRLAREVPDVLDRDVFVTGPPAFVDAALAALARAGVPRRQVHFERYAL